MSSRWSLGLFPELQAEARVYSSRTTSWGIVGRSLPTTREPVASLAAALASPVPSDWIVEREDVEV